MSDKTLQIKVVLSALANGLTRPFAQAKASSQQLRRDLASTRDELKSLGRQKNLLDRFGELKRQTGELSSELTQARAKATELGRAHAAVETPTRRMTAEFKRAREEVARLEREHQDHQRTLNATRRQLDQAGLSTDRFADHQRDLKRRIGEANDALDRQKSKLAEHGRHAARHRDAGGAAGPGGFMGKATAVGATAAGVGLAVGVPTVGAARTSADAQTDVTSIRQTVNLPRSAAPKVQAFIEQGARATNQMLGEYGASVQALVGKGMDLPSADKLATTGGKAASAYKADAKELAELNYAMFQNLKIPAELMGKVQDGVTQAGKMGSYEIGAMAGKMPEWTGAYANLGAVGPRAAYDLAASAQIVRGTAGSDDQAGNNLTNLLAQANSEQTIKNFKDLGINSTAALKKAAAEDRSVIMELVELTEKATGGDEWRIGELFGDRQARDAMMALIARKKDQEKIFAAAVKADGVVERDFNDRQQDDNEKLRALLLEKQIAERKVGDAILKRVSPLFEPLTNATKALGEFAEKEPDIVGGAFTIPTLVGMGGGGVAGGFLSGPYLEAQKQKLTDFASFVSSGWKAAIDDGLRSVLDRFASFNPLGAVIVAFNPLEAYFIGLPAKFTRWGANAIQGFINGLTGKKGEAAAAAGAAAAAAAKGAKDQLQIHSPSRVFATIGDQTMAGLIQGIRRSQSGPLAQARAVAAGLAGAATFAGVAGPQLAAAGPRAAAPAATAAAPAGDRYEIHFHPSPGMDERQLFAMFESWMARRDRERASRGRSAFADYDED